MKWKVTNPAVPQNLADLEQVLVSNRHIQNQEKFFAPPDPFSLSLEELGIDPGEMNKTMARLELARERT
jgi:hypothetical protein